MSIHDYTISDQLADPFRLDVQAALQALASTNANPTEPTTRYAYQVWADTTANKLKIRNASNSGWIVLMPLDGSYPADTIRGRITDAGIAQDLTVAQVNTMLGIGPASDSVAGLVELATDTEAVLNGEAVTIPGVAQVSSMINSTSSGYYNMQVFESSGTWTKPTGVTKVDVIVTGGGGSGSREVNYRGGNGGGTAIKFIDVSSITSVTVTVGAGGTTINVSGGGVGIAGGTSSFGTHCSATGGTGGTWIHSDNASSFAGSGIGGDINLTGQRVSSRFSAGGSYWGLSSYGVLNGVNYGCGGKGVYSGPSGTGSAGVVVIREYK